MHIVACLPSWDLFFVYLVPLNHLSRIGFWLSTIKASNFAIQLPVSKMLTFADLTYNMTTWNWYGGVAEFQIINSLLFSLLFTNNSKSISKQSCFSLPLILSYTRIVTIYLSTHIFSAFRTTLLTKKNLARTSLLTKRFQKVKIFINPMFLEVFETFKSSKISELISSEKTLAPYSPTN